MEPNANQTARAPTLRHLAYLRRLDTERAAEEKGEAPPPLSYEARHAMETHASESQSRIAAAYRQYRAHTPTFSKCWELLANPETRRAMTTAALKRCLYKMMRAELTALGETPVLLRGLMVPEYIEYIRHLLYEDPNVSPQDLKRIKDEVAAAIRAIVNTLSRFYILNNMRYHESINSMRG